jgi:hypothetical protein
MMTMPNHHWSIFSGVSLNTLCWVSQWSASHIMVFTNIHIGDPEFPKMTGHLLHCPRLYTLFSQQIVLLSHIINPFLAQPSSLSLPLAEFKLHLCSFCNLCTLMLSSSAVIFHSFCQVVSPFHDCFCYMHVCNSAPLVLHSALCHVDTYAQLDFARTAMLTTQCSIYDFGHILLAILCNWQVTYFSYFWFCIIPLMFYVLSPPVSDLYFFYIHVSYITFVWNWLMPTQFIDLLPYPYQSQSALTCLSHNPVIYSHPAMPASARSEYLYHYYHAC